jgi:hypothetical protein
MMLQQIHPTIRAIAAISHAIGAFATAPCRPIVWAVDLITALLLFLVLGRQWLSPPVCAKRGSACEAAGLAIGAPAIQTIQNDTKPPAHDITTKPRVRRDRTRQWKLNPGQVLL